MSEKKYSYSNIFSNDKINSKSPDFRGEIEIEGIKYSTSIWLKNANNNKKYLSVSIENKNKENNSRSETIKRIEKLSTLNVKNSKEISQINKSFVKQNTPYIPSKNSKKISNKFVQSKNTGSLNSKYGVSNNTSYKKNNTSSSVGTKKISKSYARYFDEPLGTREDFIKDRKRRN